MLLETGMLVYIHADGYTEAAEARAFGVQDKIVKCTEIFDTHIYYEQDRPEMGKYRLQKGSIPNRHVKYIVFEITK